MSTFAAFLSRQRRELFARGMRVRGRLERALGKLRYDLAMPLKMPYIRTQTFEVEGLAMHTARHGVPAVPAGEVRRRVAVASVRAAPVLASGEPGFGDDDADTVTKVRPAKPKLEKPPLYKVIILNDDYTPMEFVVVVLMRFFRMDEEKAWQLMYAVHTTGSAVVGIFPRDIAETKSEQVNAYAQEHNHPLRSTVEMSD